MSLQVNRRIKNPIVPQKAGTFGIEIYVRKVLIMVPPPRFGLVIPSYLP
jgi:hypothetical protein